MLQRLPHHNRPGAPAISKVQLLDRCINVVIISVCLQLGGLEHCFGLAVSCDTGVHGRCPSGGSTGQRFEAWVEVPGSCRSTQYLTPSRQAEYLVKTGAWGLPGACQCCLPPSMRGLRLAKIKSFDPMDPMPWPVRKSGCVDSANSLAPAGLY